MPNNQAKLKFDAEFLSRCEHGIWSAEALFRAIKPRYQVGRYGNLIEVKHALQHIKDYGYWNIGRNPALDDSTFLKHEEADVRMVRNAKASLITLFRTVNIVKQQGLKGEYAKALELFNQFQTYLEGIVGNE